MRRSIKITCQGAATAKLEELVPLQGGLKTLGPEQYRKLKRTLLSDDGFSFPFFVWKDEGKLKILDGHQRDRVLRRLKAQGYAIPPLPVDFIDARDETEARRKILLLSSQYGQMTEDNLMEFLKESEIDLDDVLDTVELDQVDIEKLSESLEQQLSEKSSPGADGKLYQVIVECGDKKEQKTLVAKLKKQGHSAHAVTLDS